MAVSNYLFNPLVLIQVISYTFSQDVSESPKSQTFCYDDSSCGPSSPLWSGMCQTGDSQSPIDLPSLAWSTLLFSPFERLTFNGEYRSSEFYVANNGHAIQLSFSPDLNSTAQMSGYGLSDPYIFSQLHFHWGDSSSSKGSEHTVGGKPHRMEMHFVHYNSKYPSISAAEDSGDPAALAVLGVFIRPVQYDIFTFSNRVQAEFNLISNYLPVEVTSTPIKVSKRVDLSHFLPKLADGVYRYNGSLTSPPCSEQVIWTVKSKPVKISLLQGFTRFTSRRIKDDRGLELVNNFRPLQPSNGRTVEYFRKL